MLIDVEEAVRRALERNLELEQVGPEDDFFAIGGTSLLAARLIAELNSELGLSVGFRILADNPTRSSLAAALSAELARC
jgi:hypothetical protein